MRLQVQGWRGIHHAYALVNQFQALAWLAQGVPSLVHDDQAFLSTRWQQPNHAAGLSAQDMAQIQQLPSEGPFDAVYRIFAPLPEVQIDASWPILVLAGLLVGVGTRYGAGCTSGHGVCGLSRLSPRSLVATLAFMGAGFATVFVLRHLP